VRRNLLFLFLAALVVSCSKEPDKSFFDRFDTTPIDYSAEAARAKAGHKLLLLEFGSSDSCAPCMEFQKDVFSQPEFTGYESSNLVFVRIDVPANSKLPPSVEATNILLSKQFDVFAFPTFVAMDDAGQEIWRMPAKDDPNPGIDTRLFKPSEFIALIESVKAKRK